MSRERNPLLTAYALPRLRCSCSRRSSILILFSFNDSRRTFVWRGFTTEWYGKLLANDDLLDALGITLRVAVVAVLISTVLGSLLGLGLARLRFRGRGATETLLLLPMVTPEIVMGLSLLLFFLQLFDGARLVRAAHDRAHHVLRVVRGDHGPGAGLGHERRSWRRPHATSGRRRSGRSGT